MFEHDWTAASIAPIVAEVLDQFAAPRVMFGSNFPVDKLTSDYATLAGAYRALVPAEAQPRVFHDRAAEFYGL